MACPCTFRPVVLLPAALYACAGAILTPIFLVLSLPLRRTFVVFLTPHWLTIMPPAKSSFTVFARKHENLILVLENWKIDCGLAENENEKQPHLKIMANHWPLFVPVHFVKKASIFARTWQENASREELTQLQAPLG